MLLDKIATGLLANLIVATIFYLLGLLTSGKIKPFLKNGLAWTFNSEVQASIKRRDIYNDPNANIDISSFSTEIYDEICERYDGEVVSPRYNKSEVVVDVEKIPNEIAVKIDEERGISGASMSEEVKGYRIEISPRGDLRFGYRSDESLKQFEKFASAASAAVQAKYFHGDQPDESNVDVAIKQGVPELSGEVRDDDLEISAHLDGSVLRMTLNNPDYLVDGIKKFVSPN
ncbi:hypothetical protein [Haloarcula sp. K1]|uniref:hypothetical protein n=1 Tax=Haloarcula sp. K1 TaxID=1622207 RepID=UPI000AB472F0|nr:hypothetical protein [Haloarcula sp. K1]